MFRIIIPFAPGGATDAVARPLAARLQEQFGQAFIIENKVGANGNGGGIPQGGPAAMNLDPISNVTAAQTNVEAADDDLPF